MALLNKLMDKAVSLATDEAKQKEWTARGFDAAMAEARTLNDAIDTDSEELKAVKNTTQFGLDRIERGKDKLVGLGAHGLRSTLLLVGLGNYNSAAKHAAIISLRENASWGEVSTAITDAAKAGNQAKRDLDASIAEFKSILKDIGVSAAKAALPILLAVL